MTEIPGQAPALLCPYVFHREGKTLGDFRDAWEKAAIATGLGQIVESEENGKKKKKYTGKILHDFRRTARTQLAELGVAPHVAELCLNHKPKGVEAVYNKHTYFAERRAALKSWADVLVQIEAGQSKIVPIRSRKR